MSKKGKTIARLIVDIGMILFALIAALISKHYLNIAPMLSLSTSVIMLPCLIFSIVSFHQNLSDLELILEQENHKEKRLK